MLPRILPVLVLFPTLLAAQARPATATTWMDLAVGTDLSYTVEDRNELADTAGGIGSGGSGKHEVRILALGPDGNGALRVAIFDEQLPEESFETPIVRAEIAVLDPATGALQRDAKAGDGTRAAVWSMHSVFPFPPLSPAEWKGKKAVSRAGWVPVAGEPRELPLRFSFASQKVGKKLVPSLVVELDSKQPVGVQLVGIAGIVGMAQGQMPKLGASGIEPVDAEVVALRREGTIDLAKGRITEIRTTGTVTAADGKVKISCTNTQRETARRIVPAKELPLVVEVVEELCAIANDLGDKAERKQRAEALLPKAKAAGLAPTAARLLDSLTRDGLPPGLPR